MRFVRILLLGSVGLAVMTSAVLLLGLLALRGVSSQHLRSSRDFAADVTAAEQLRARGEELTAVHRASPSRTALQPWVVHWGERVHAVITELGERDAEPGRLRYVRDIEQAAGACATACLNEADEQRLRAVHDELEAAISRFVDREATRFAHASSLMDDKASRYELALAILSILVVASGTMLATVALRKLGHLLRREQAATAIAQREAAARQEVLAIVSHDLRTPLSAIVLGSALLSESLPESGEPRGPRRQVQVIRNAADRMTDLIDEILDTARIEAGTMKLHIAPCDVHDVLDNIIELFQLRAAGKSVTLRAKLPPGRLQVMADSERLLQILSNLTSNAVKFTPPGGEIITSVEARNDHVVFSVQDTGPGIPAEQREHLFDRYWQAEGSERRGSLGLGLFICKSLVDAHDGRIWFEAPESGGSRFCFTIPCVRRPPQRFDASR